MVERSSDQAQLGIRAGSRSEIRPGPQRRLDATPEAAEAVALDDLFQRPAPSIKRVRRGHGSSRQRLGEMLVLDAINETTVILAAQAAVLLVMERDASGGALIAHKANRRHI